MPRVLRGGLLIVRLQVQFLSNSLPRKTAPRPPEDQPLRRSRCSPVAASLKMALKDLAEPALQRRRDLVAHRALRETIDQGLEQALDDQLLALYRIESERGERVQLIATDLVP